MGSAKNEFNQIKQELQSIIYELSNISNGIRYDFKGIASNRCSDSLDSLVEKYKKVKRTLDGIDFPDNK